MDVAKFFNEGGYTVPNPKYNKKKKNNIEPPTILDTDPTNHRLAVADAVNRAAANDYFMGDTHKVRELGITPYRGMDEASILADNQSNWRKVANSLGQTIFSEIGVGTLKGFSDLFGFIGGKLGMTDDPYHNAVSDMFASWQTYLQEEAMPIYVKPGLDISNGGLLDVGWYAKNFPSVASSLTLLLPARAVTGGVSKIGKMLGAEKAMAKTGKWLSASRRLDEGAQLNSFQKFVNNPIKREVAKEAAQTLGEAYLMRTMENYQEAGEVHTQTYQNALESFNNMSDEEFNQWRENNQKLFQDADGNPTANLDDRNNAAKAVAKKAADKTFGMDFANIVFDFVQLWGLKNVGKVKKARGTGVTKAQEESIKELKKFGAEKAGREIVEEVPKKNFIKKGLEPVGRFFKDSGKLILEESTEGIEEAVNMIAQQEGITYGKMMVEGTTGDKNYSSNGWLPVGEALNTVVNSFNLFNTYKNNPELWEQAFWGVMGGVIFGGVTNQLNKYQTKQANKKHEKELEKAGVDIAEYKKKNKWMDYYDDANTKAAKAALHNRTENFRSLVEDLAEIAQGNNIYDTKDDDDGNYKKFKKNPKLEQELARARRIAQFRGQIAKDALNSGTYEWTTDYFQSDDVKQAMIDLGIVESKEEADTFAKETIADMNEVKKIYNDQVSIAMAQATAINADRNYTEKIPIEYVRMVAAQNADNLMLARNIQKEIDALGVEGDEILAKLKDSGVDTRTFLNDKNLIKVGALTDLYSRLEADKKYIKENEDDDIEARMKIKSIERQQEAITKQLLSLDGGTNYMLNAVRTAKTYIKVLGDDGTGKQRLDYYIDRNAEVFNQTDEDLIKEYENVLKNGRENPFSPDEITTMSQLAKVVGQNLKNLNSENGLKKTHEALFNVYARGSFLEFNKLQALSHVATTRSEFTEQIDLIHNRLNRARLEAIREKDIIINNLYKKYKDVAGDKIEKALADAVTGNRQEIRQQLSEFMSSDDVQSFFDAIDIFRFQNASNEEIAGYITDGIRKQKELDAVKREETTTSENQSGETETSSTDTSSETPPTSAETGSTEATPSAPTQSSQQAIAQITPTPQVANTSTESAPSTEPATDPSEARRPITGPVTAVSVNIDDEGKTTITSDTSGSYQLEQLDSGLYELRLNPDDDLTKVRFANSDVMRLDNPDGLLLFDENTELSLVDNPMFRKKDDGSFELATPGLIRARRNIDGEEGGTAETETGTSPVEDNGSALQAPATPAENTPRPPAASSTEEAPANKEEVKKAELENKKELEKILKGEEESEPSSSSTGGQSNELYSEEEKARDAMLEKLHDFMDNQEINLGDLSIDYEDVRARLKAEFNDALTMRLIDELIDNAKAAREKLKALMANVNADPLSTAAGEVAFYARFESPELLFTNLFKETAESFIQKYAAATILPVVDGKQVIRVADILKLCLDSFGTTNVTAATNFFNVVKAYLQNVVNDPDNHCRENYILLDENDINSADIVSRIVGYDTTYNPIDEHTFDINLKDMFLNYMDFATDEDIEQYHKVMDSLKSGDKLTLEMLPDRSKFNLVKDGIIVGTLSIPHPNVDGEYVLTEKGWVFRAKRNVDGEVVGELKNFIKRIFLEDSPYAEDLRRIIVEAQIKGITDEVLNDFEDNEIIKHEIDRSLEQGSTTNLIFNYDGELEDSKTLLQHLVNISVGYVLNQGVTGNIETNRQIIANSLDNWFEKIYNQAEHIALLMDGAEATVEYVNRGRLITNVTKPRGTAYTYDDHIPVSEAANPSEDFRITVVDNFVGNISGRPSQTEGFEGRNFATLVSVFDEDGHPYYTNAWGVQCNDHNIYNSHPFIKDMTRSVCNYLRNAVSEAKNEQDVIKALSAILNINNSNVDTIPLFRATRGQFTIQLIKSQTGLVTGVDLIYKDSNVDAYGVSVPTYINFHIYTRSGKFNKAMIGYQIKGLNRYDQAVHYKGKDCPDPAGDIGNILASILGKCCQVNIDKRGIALDNSSENQTKGFISKENGRVTIDIPGTKFKQSFNSYNDFLIKGDLIKVNLNKNQYGSNFEKFETNSVYNQKLFVSLPLVSKGKENKADKYEHVDDTALEVVEQMDKVREIIESDSPTKTQDVLNEIVPEENRKDLQTLLDIFSDDLYGIIPQNIEYDPNMNIYTDHWIGGIAASLGSGNKRNTSYRQFKRGQNAKRGNLDSNTAYVGTWWLNMAASKNKARRRNAIGKLIHEALHNRLARNQKEREQILDSLRGVRDTFWNTVLDRLEEIEKIPQDKRTPAQQQLWRVYNNIHESLRTASALSSNLTEERKRKAELKITEEFLVESLTNRDWYSTLNDIQVDDAGTGNKESLWSKLLNAIRKLFGWEEVKANSLMEKELNILRNIGDTTNSTDNAIDNATDENIQEQNDDNLTPPVENMVNDESNSTPSETPSSTDSASNVSEPLIESTNDNPQSINDVTLDDFNLDDFDMDAPFALREESTSELPTYNTAMIGKQSGSYAGLLGSMNSQNREQFEELIEDGFYELKCK